jgi:hypothetical protein
MPAISCSGFIRTSLKLRPGMMLLLRASTLFLQAEGHINTCPIWCARVVFLPLKLKVAVEKSTATFIWWEIFPAARDSMYTESGVELGLHLDCSGE